MKLTKEMDRYIKPYNIDFTDFYILELFPVDEKNAVLFLAPRVENPHNNFNLQYRDASNYYGNIENMMASAVLNNLITRKQANVIIDNYNKGE